MNAETRKVAAFRKRLAARQANWAIDISARKRITLELTREQQELLRTVTKQVVPSVTLVFSSDMIEPTGNVLAMLELPDSATSSKPRSRTPGRRAAR